MQLSRLADTAERDYFTPQREADHYAKTTGRNSRSILYRVSVDRVGSYRWATHAIIVSNTHRASSGV